MGTKGTWQRPSDKAMYDDGFAGLGDSGCEGCKKGLPLKSGVHYEFGRLHSGCKSKKRLEGGS